MQIQYYFGPAKVPFGLDEGHALISTSEEVPFHGIVSRGVLNTLKNKQLAVADWLMCAPLLECDAQETNAPKPDKVKTFLNIAKQQLVLTFAQSAHAIRRYLELYANNLLDGQAYECWNIKEGLTSSVWKIRVLGDQQKPLNTFVLNVGRDIEANRELKTLSKKLHKVGRKTPDINLAKVLDIQQVEDIGLPKTIVTMNEWIDDSFELHARTNSKSGHVELLMVDRFITNPEQPANITSVLGRVLSKAEYDLVQQQIDHFLSTASKLLPSTPEININDGDVVWCPDNQTAVVIAIS